MDINMQYADWHDDVGRWYTVDWPATLKCGAICWKPREAPNGH